MMIRASSFLLMVSGMPPTSKERRDGNGNYQKYQPGSFSKPPRRAVMDNCVHLEELRMTKE